MMIKTFDCKSGDELFEALSARSIHFRESDPEQWIFRGERGATRALTPSAFRPEAWDRFPTYSAEPWADFSNREQVVIEQNVLRDFFTKADHAGLALPEDSQLLRRRLLDILDERSVAKRLEEPWPPEELWSMVALAQHYGVPTRFLDWTRSAFAAMYFAVERTAHAKDPAMEPFIEIWAYSVSLHYITNYIRPRSAKAAATIHIVTAPYAGNPNLAAQRGVHMHYHSVALDPAASANRISFGEELPRLHALRRHSGSPRENALLHFTLPPTEAGTVLRFLAKEGVTAASLFPGYAGVVKAMQNEKAIQKR